MRILRLVVAGAGTLALFIGVATLPADPPLYMLPSVAGCLTTAVILATWPGCRRWLAVTGVGVGVVSLAVTALMMTVVDPGSGEPVPPTSLWLLLEPGVMLVFVYLPVRWSSPRAAVWGGGAAALGGALNVQRYVQDTPLADRIPASAIWLVPAVAVGAIAWYLRSLEAGHERAVVEARQHQRLELAADLHDFVAHDVSEIVAQAQAGSVVLTPADPRLAEVLQRIETAGLRALTSMDRTVHMLRDTDGAAVTAAKGLADVPELVSRFESAGTIRARLDDRITRPIEPHQNTRSNGDVGDRPSGDAPSRLDGQAGGDAGARLDDRACGDVPRELGALGYRLIVEALTNVRRHAGGATLVTVRLARQDGRLLVSVTDDGRGGTANPGRVGSGTGLAGLSERVAALGGELTAEARHPHGWHVEARLPLPDGR
ncbi:MAG: sensor histidine kinase [Stackebrandtia sp.]